MAKSGRSPLVNARARMCMCACTTHTLASQGGLRSLLRTAGNMGLVGARRQRGVWDLHGRPACDPPRTGRTSFVAIRRLLSRSCYELKAMCTGRGIVLASSSSRTFWRITRGPSNTAIDTLYYQSSLPEPLYSRVERDGTRQTWQPEEDTSPTC